MRNDLLAGVLDNLRGFFAFRYFAFIDNAMKIEPTVTVGPGAVMVAILHTGKAGLRPAAVALSSARRFPPALPFEDQLKFPALGFNLRQQALAEIACGNAHRIELADHGESGFQVGPGTIEHGLGQLSQCSVAVLADGPRFACAPVRLLICALTRASVSVRIRTYLRSELLAQITLEQLFIACRQIAIFVQIADDVLGCVANRR